MEPLLLEAFCHQCRFRLPSRICVERKKVRWSINSRQGARYIKQRMGNELKSKILEYNGIITDHNHQSKPLVSECPKCQLTNVPENMYCSDCPIRERRPRLRK